MLKDVIAPLLVTMDDYLSVRICPKDVTMGLKLCLKLGEVVNFAVENDPNRSISIGHRLMPARKVDNRETPKSQTNRTGHILSFVVGPSMRNSIRHLFDCIRIYGTVGYKIKLT